MGNTVIAGKVLENFPAAGECGSNLLPLGNNLFQEDTESTPADRDGIVHIGKPAGLAATTADCALLIGSTLGIHAGILTRAPLPTRLVVVLSVSVSSDTFLIFANVVEPPA